MSPRIFQLYTNHLTAIQETTSNQRRAHRLCTTNPYGIYPFVYPSAPKRQKGLADFSAKPLNHLVGAAGFELATLCSQSRCATRLRYAPNSTKYNLFLLSKRISRTFLHCTGKPILESLPAHHRAARHRHKSRSTSWSGLQSCANRESGWLIYG